MIPTLKEEEKQQIMAWLIEARELAIDAESSKKKHEVCGKYKGRINSTSVLKYTTAAECPDCDFAGTATAAGGVNPYASLESECATLNGGDGTVRFVHVLPPPGVIFIFK